MTVEIFSHSADASAHYRLLEPARVLGVRVHERAADVSADTVVMNRPLLEEHADLIERWVAEGRTVIVDMDDDFEHLSPRHAISGQVATHHLNRACKAASIITTSTPALAELYGHGNPTAVLPNCVPAALLSTHPAGRRNPELWVGWYGSIGAHPDDVQVLGTSVADVLDEHQSARFVHLGPTGDAPALRSMLGIPDLLSLGYVSLHGLPGVISEYTVSLVPLVDSVFNRSKSCLKAMESAACGVPVIMSPTADNLRLHDLGVGLLAHDADEWRAWLTMLLADETTRADVAEQQRSAMRALTYEAKARSWADVWGH